MKRNYGLIPLEPDSRDFQLGAFDQLPELEDLPEEFLLPYRVKDQTTTDWCSAFATCAASEVQEGIELEPGYSFAASKDIQGNPDSWGCDLRTACKSHQKYGALPSSEVPVEIRKIPLKDYRYWEVWKELLPLALQHKKQSYFKITGPYDDYDNIKASIFKYKTPIVIGIQFGYKLTDVYFNQPKQGFGHALAIVGYTQDYLIVLNSYGKKAGDNGLHYISREVINHWVGIYGAFTFIDVDPEEVGKKKIWWQRLLEWLLSMI